MKSGVIITLVFLFCITTAANAQILDRVLNRTKEKTKSKTEQKTDNTIDKGLDKVEKGIENIFKKKEKKKDKKSSNESSGRNNTTSSDDVAFEQYKGSSFVPGKNVLFFEDFSTAKLSPGSGNWHVYEYDPSEDIEKPNVGTIPAAGGNWLKMPRKGFAFPNSFKNLPEQFTVEFDMYADPESMNEMEGGFRTNFTTRNDREEYSIHWDTEPAVCIDVHPHGSDEMVNMMVTTEYNSNLNREDMVLFENTFKSGWNPGEVNRISIYRNGRHIILYINGKEIINLPNALTKKGQYNLIFSTNLWGDGIYVSNIRVAGNIPNASQDIKDTGKFVTNAIYFDVNSSHIKPESWATLNNTAQAIKASSGTILIVGHTDSDGADDANLKLSKNRADSVKNILVKEFGIDASRLVTDGKGETQPLTSNNTASGKAQNRRVEFIKQ
ncbi:OmpA family protein [Flavobacterium sp. MK4S-17]|uniref:OmpA family protein n=1 Tax=Flavobacterium sp. MK4S-17 TaxID=2543737 RepID=UPI00135C8701|nr:OmpA family protein [Flavobacterium sp. MK4S-17]